MAGLVPPLLEQLFRLFPAPLTKHTLDVGKRAWQHLSRGGGAAGGAQQPRIIPELVVLRAAFQGGLAVPKLAPQSPSRRGGGGGGGSGGGGTPAGVVTAAAAARLALRRQFLGVFQTLAGCPSTSTLSVENLYYFSACLCQLTSALALRSEPDADGTRRPYLSGDPRIGPTVFGAATQCFRCIAAAAALEVCFAGREHPHSILFAWSYVVVSLCLHVAHTRSVIPMQQFADKTRLRATE